ncbi:ABC transporter ATP-binding protein [archaeon]|jgi:putative ABC transport system ATP-binding protein|nr:ABC transporter ATP-binding protein [archaeon]MBT4242063.1 ABC transporter ATP-binding protein [archaeon]MBT4417751.1 ABC transporter ATP-binding protein [archaeon]
MVERKKKTNNEIIRLKNVAKWYKAGDEIVKAVDGVDIVINKGDFVAIVGPSGSGKSTAMNLVGALDIATKGDIFLDNINIEKLHESDLAQIRGRKIGFVFQTFNLIPTLTALENVTLPMIFQRVPYEERVARAKELLTKVGLDHRLTHLPNMLSGGERQRVAVARALANDPEVILADEPTGNLDTKRGEEVAQMFNKLSDEGKTIILVTHDMYVAKHADRIYKLKDGKIENKSGRK